MPIDLDALRSAFYKPRLFSTHRARYRMRCYRWWQVAVAIVLLFVPAVMAQDPVTVPPPPTVAAPTTIAPVAPPATGFWGTICASCAAKKLAFANSPLCKLLKNALGPLSALTGGLVPGQVPPGAVALATPGSVGAAAAIKRDQQQAALRREAVRFLGTIDCHWYPEAEAGLIAALRIDRVECVRYEAACALARGCCCTKATIEALTICVGGSDRDGNPSENSLRVQLKALEALQHCVGNYQGEAGEQAQPRPEYPASREVAEPEKITGLPDIPFTAYYQKVRAAPRDEVLANAKRIADIASQRKIILPATPRRSGSVMEIWAAAEREATPTVRPAGTAP
jgi:hypothetical protein